MSDKTPMQYDLKTGYPPTEIIPRAVLADVAAQVFQKDAALQYADSQNGDPWTRRQIAAWLTANTTATVTAADLHLTAGAIPGIDLACRYVTKPGDVILVENPTFYYITQKMATHHVDVVGVPLDAEGVDLGALAKACDLYGDRVTMFYAIPSFHNPTGLTYPAERRKALVNMARERNFTIVEDATYQVMYFGNPPPPMLREYDTDSGHVITIGSFSKLLMPSIRIGWMWLTPAQAEAIKVPSSDDASTFMSQVVGEMLASGELDLHMESVEGFYGAKHDRVVAALQAYAPDWLTWTAPNGGYFIWLALPASIAATDVLEAANARGVDFMLGRLAFVNGAAPDRYIRLCFARERDEILSRGIEILCDVLKTMPIRV